MQHPLDAMTCTHLRQQSRIAKFNKRFAGIGARKSE
jgi:ribosomal protein L31